MPPRFASAVLQFATLPVSSTSYAPRITVWIQPPRAISNEVTLSKNDAPGVERDELAGGVVDVGIDLVLFRHHAPVAEDAVLGVQDHVAALEVVRDHRRDADAEIARRCLPCTSFAAFLAMPWRVSAGLSL